MRKAGICLVCVCLLGLLCLVPAFAEQSDSGVAALEEYPEAKAIFDQKMAEGLSWSEALDAVPERLLSREPDWEELVGFWEASGLADNVWAQLAAELVGVDLEEYLESSLDGYLLMDDATIYQVTGTRDDPDITMVDCAAGVDEYGVFSMTMYCGDDARKLKYLLNELCFEGYDSWGEWGSTTYVKSMTVEEFYESVQGLNAGDAQEVTREALMGTWLIRNDEETLYAFVIREGTLDYIPREIYDTFKVYRNIPYTCMGSTILMEGFPELRLSFEDGTLSIFSRYTDGSWCHETEDMTTTAVSGGLLGEVETAYAGTWTGLDVSNGDFISVSLNEDGTASCSTGEEQGDGIWGVRDGVLKLCIPSEHGISLQFYDNFRLSDDGEKLLVLKSDNQYSELRKAVVSDSCFRVISVDDGIAILGWNENASAVPETLVIPSTIDGIPVVKLGDEAFKGCDTLQSVSFEGAMEIGKSAFAVCGNLQKADLTALTMIGEGMFSSCGMLTEISMPEEVTFFGESAFAYCASLEVLELPEGVTTITNAMLQGCKALTAVYVPRSAVEFEKHTIGGTEALLKNHPWTEFHVYPNTEAEKWFNFRSVGGDAYKLVYRLTEEEKKLIINSVTENDGKITRTLYADGTLVISGQGIVRSFVDDSRITSIVVEDGITEIDAYAFGRMKSVKSLTLPDTVTRIGEKAFFMMTGLEHITLPAGITRIENQTFNYCGKLEQLELPETLESIGEAGLSGCYKLCNIEIPDGVKTLEDRAFDGDFTLIRMKLPDSLESIGSCAFGSCSQLEAIWIPDSVTSIGDHAFAFCDVLTVYGNPGSYAETYCLNEGIPFSTDPYPGE